MHVLQYLLRRPAKALHLAMGALFYRRLPRESRVSEIDGIVTHHNGVWYEALPRGVVVKLVVRRRFDLGRPSFASLLLPLSLDKSSGGDVVVTRIPHDSRGG